ncbi:hypothetical protein Pcinc_022321 [Petrolisthes cinctipes]|uniref:CIDE-N domain-containing protein n=1 Tax=Petrolisthes cinctipes TaxID=88211 RepID=A0AAE1KH94_PETCI|nr:hypothetical protein Pcinc_022321 [Petrolisthes cinctipes]
MMSRVSGMMSGVSGVMSGKGERSDEWGDWDDESGEWVDEWGREKLELGEVRIKVVLEADGTQVEDPEYFYTLPENTVFLLLRQGEHWYPAGVEVLRQGKYPCYTTLF